jgi:CRP/FNR family cyclic AMP-dependent transcriptional regulator
MRMSPYPLTARPLEARMPLLSVLDLLTAHPIAAGLPDGQLLRLAEHARPVHRFAGYRLFRADDPADRFWLLHSGAVALDLPVPGRGDVVIEKVDTDTMVGWSWLLAPYRWRFGAVVADDMRAVEFDAVGVRALLAEETDLARHFDHRCLAVVADRLQAARRRLAELYAYPSVPE